MKNIKYIEGDATNPVGGGPRIITHICNNERKWGRGFVLSISKRWKLPEKVYRNSINMDLGSTQLCEVEPNLFVFNMIAQDGIRSCNCGQRAVQYDVLESCLKELSIIAKEKIASVHMPRIGAGLGGGDWNVIEQIIINTLCENDIDVYVYDYKPNKRISIRT